MDYEEFSAQSPGSGKRYHCRFHTLTTGISPRHSDTVDVKFLVNGKGVVIALSHEAFAQFRQRTGRVLTDENAIQMAGLFLKELLEKGESAEDRLLVLAPQQATELAARIPSLGPG